MLPSRSFSIDFIPSLAPAGRRDVIRSWGYCTTPRPARKWKSGREAQVSAARQACFIHNFYFFIGRTYGILLANMAFAAGRRPVPPPA